MYKNGIDTIVSFDDDFNHINNITRVYIYFNYNMLFHFV